MRLIKTLQLGDLTAKVYLDTDEYRVKYYRNGNHFGEDYDSFEDDYAAAEGTAKAELSFMCANAIICA